MLKEVGILAGGIFIGAAGAEIVRRSCPGGLSRMGRALADMTGAAREAFVEGYRESVGTGDTSPNDVASSPA